MEIKEAIAILARIQEPEAWEPQITKEAWQALEMAKEALVKESQVLAKDLPDTNVGNCSETPNNSDSISRQAAIDEIDEWIKAFRENGHKESAADARLIKDGIIQLPSAQPEPQWIPCTLRPLTADEKEENPDWDCILVGRLPDDGQMILVTINIVGHESVQCDTYYDDDGSYLESGYEIGTEATAWMPMPAPYRGGKNV